MAVAGLIVVVLDAEAFQDSFEELTIREIGGFNMGCTVHVTSSSLLAFSISNHELDRCLFTPEAA
jgi:hypothetical protein